MAAAVWRRTSRARIGTCVLMVTAAATLIPAMATGAPPASLGGGGLIAFRSCEGERSLLRVIGPDGSQSRVIRAYPEFKGPVDCPWGKAEWSWDGRRLLAEGPFLEVLNPRGRVLRRVEIPHDDTSWTPDRRGVTTTSGAPGRQAIKEFGLDGKTRGRITPYWSYVGWHEWSRDGRTLAYERVDVERNIAEIRLVDRGRRRDRRLVAGGLPRWSPDGRRIGYQLGNDVWTVRRDGRDRRRLVDNDPGGASAGWHDWSPDGRWIVSRASAASTDPFDPLLQLRFVRTDGRRERRLTLPGQVEYAYPLAWQPARR